MHLRQHQGDRVTRWLGANADLELTDTIVTQSLRRRFIGSP
jgi:hypothetical protein